MRDSAIVVAQARGRLMQEGSMFGEWDIDIDT